MSEFSPEKAPALSLSEEAVFALGLWKDALASLHRFEVARDATIAICALYGDEDPGTRNDVLALEEMPTGQIPWVDTLRLSRAGNKVE